jgi:hypothetical protein
MLLSYSYRTVQLCALVLLVAVVENSN